MADVVPQTSVPNGKDKKQKRKRKSKDVKVNQSESSKDQAKSIGDSSNGHANGTNGEKKKKRKRDDSADASIVAPSNGTNGEKKKKKKKSKSVSGEPDHANGANGEKKKKKKSNDKKSKAENGTNGQTNGTNGAESNGHTNGAKGEKKKKKKSKDKKRKVESETNGHSKSEENGRPIKKSKTSAAESPISESDRQRISEEWRQKESISLSGDDIDSFLPFLTFEDADGKFPEKAMTLIKGKFEKPTPIQSQCWPILAAKRDVVGIAETGSGKTLAFLLPALLHIQQSTGGKSKDPIVLILSPTRELAMQTAEVAEEVGAVAGAKSVCIYGKWIKIWYLIFKNTN